jgi:hypothetical protein
MARTNRVHALITAWMTGVPCIALSGQLGGLNATLDAVVGRTSGALATV